MRFVLIPAVLLALLSRAPSGVTAAVVGCGSKSATVGVAWTVLPNSLVTYTTATVNNVQGSGRIAAYTNGGLSMSLPFTTHSIDVIDWTPDGAGALTPSVPTTVQLVVAKKDGRTLR